MFYHHYCLLPHADNNHFDDHQTAASSECCCCCCCLGEHSPDSNASTAVSTTNTPICSQRLKLSGVVDDASSLPCDAFSPSTQVLIKNTFIQFDEGTPIKYEVAHRPRGSSCDAVLTGPHLGRHKLETLSAIPEHVGRSSCTCVPPIYCDHCREESHDPEHLNTTRADLSPGELADSLSNCLPLHRMPLDKLPGGLTGTAMDSVSSPNEKTTVMLRNIPNKYTQSMLLEAVDQDFKGLYDFFYLPIDFKNKCNVGYAFINFIHPYYANLFATKFAGLKLTAFKSKKICEVSWGRVQGLRANIEHYRNSVIMSLPNPQYKPLLFKDGISLQFPGPANQPAALTSSTSTTASSSNGSSPHKNRHHRHYHGKKA